MSRAKAEEVGMAYGFVGVLVTAMVALLLAASPASAALEITDIGGGAFDDLGGVETRAGSYPHTGEADFSLSTVLSPSGVAVPTEALKDVEVDLPAGLIGNPQAVPVACTEKELNDVPAPTCPLESQVGVAILRLQVCSFCSVSLQYKPLYLMKAPEGTAALLGFNHVGAIVHIAADLERIGGEYKVRAISLNAPQTFAVHGVETVLWGVPAASTHDTERGEVGGIGCANPGSSCPPAPSSASPKPFLRLPTSCAGDVETSIRVTSWEGSSDEASFVSPGGTECDELEFEPTLEARPTTNVADSPSGFDVHLHLPQNEDPEKRATADLRKTVVELPEGLVVNPASANGLDACSSAQIDLQGPAPAECPDASKLGTVEVQTPLLDHPVPGAVFIAKPFDNPFDSLLAIYIAIDDPISGTVIKLAGEVEADPQTGRLRTTFDENPQLPFEDFRLKFFGGPQGALRTPATCGTYSTTSALTPWSAPDSGPPATPSDTYLITHGPHGICASTSSLRAHAPSFDAGTVSPRAGAYSPLTVNLRREDASQEFSAVTLTPPPGLVGRLAGTPACPDSALAAAAAKTGNEEKANPSCPPASEVGSVTVGAGAGPSPYHTSGRAYLGGPYKGAPLSLAIVTPATAGPFDLGTVVVKSALYVDPRTAQITAVSDPIPHILQGIVLDVRTVAVRLDKPQFTLNPTSCNPMAFGGQLLSTLGQAASLQSRFQVGECDRLGFKPKLDLRLVGGARRGDNPKLIAALKTRPGDANIASARVTLPRSAFLDQAHIRTVCTRVQFAADQCPEGSIYGRASATTPLLDYPLAGNVYLRSSDNKLPDLVSDLRGPAHQPVRIELVGRTDSVRGALRNSFDVAPDAPASTFRLELFGGRRGLVVNSSDICARKYRATVVLRAQNGLVHESRPLVRNANCGKRRADSGWKRDSRSSGTL